jgi:large subunit ribosomal protein L12
MEYIYGALLLHSAGQKINESSLKKVMEASGVKVDAAKVKALVASLEGVNIDEALSSAALVAAAAPAAAAPAAGPAPAAAEEKKEEEQEKATEEAAEGLGALFG